MANIHPAAMEIELLLRECKSSRTRRSGPGGQHRNKVETACILEHLPSGVTAEANERRSLAENQKEAIHRLRVRLAVTVRGNSIESPPISELWSGRTQSGKLIVSAAHEDFPALLAEALDHLSHAEYQTAPAAQRLGVSTTSLVNLLAKAPEAFTMVNLARQARAMPKLRANT